MQALTNILRSGAFAVPQAILEDGTVLMNLTEVTAGSSKGKKRQAMDDRGGGRTPGILYSSP